MDEEEAPRQFPVSDKLEVDLDGPRVVFRDGTAAGVDGDYDCGVLPEARIRPLSLNELDAALGAIAEGDEWAADLWVIDTDPPDRIHEVEPLDGIALHTGGQGELCVLVDIDLPRYVDESFESEVPALVGPMLAESGARWKVPFHPPGHIFEDNFVLMAEFEVMTERRVEDLLDLGLAVRALMKAARRGEFTRQIARDLLRAGRAQALLGQRESEWLEAKSQPWDLRGDAGKYEMVKDLSAFANAGGGLVVVPARTRVENGGEVISELRAMPLSRFDETQLRDTAAQRIVPPLNELQVDVVERTSDRGYVVVSVGPHRAQDWPHLVVGDGTAPFPSASVSAFVRDGDKNRALTATDLHRLMQGQGNTTQGVQGEGGE